MSKDLHAKVRQMFQQAGLDRPEDIHHLGHGELNNSYKVHAGGKDYCLRIAKYEGKQGLAREADALHRIPPGIGPEVIFFPEKATNDDRFWIIESFIDGTTPQRLNHEQFYSLGTKLACLHAVSAPETDVINAGEVSMDKSQLWDYLVWTCRSLYPAKVILTSLPDIRVTRLAQKVKLWFEQQQQEHDFNVPKMLLHKDVTPSNMLVQGNNTFLIDWEFRDFGDPMTDFSTGFWDMDLNEGKWRIALTESEREQLYAGYQDAGGKLDEAKVDTWMTFDKIGVAVFLCLRIYSPPEDTTPELQAQYRKDLDAIISSLEQKF